MKIFNILVECCREQPLYINPFVELLQNCSKPFLLERSTDADIYASVLTAFYADFGRMFVVGADERAWCPSGYLLRSPNKRIQQGVLEALYQTVQPTNRSPIGDDDYAGMRPIRIGQLLKSQCHSDLCETLVKVRRETSRRGRNDDCSRRCPSWKTT